MLLALCLTPSEESILHDFVTIPSSKDVGRPSELQISFLFTYYTQRGRISEALNLNSHFPGNPKRDQVVEVLKRGLPTIQLMSIEVSHEVEKDNAQVWEIEESLMEENKEVMEDFASERENSSVEDKGPSTDKTTPSGKRDSLPLSTSPMPHSTIKQGVTSIATPSKSDQDIRASTPVQQQQPLQPVMGQNTTRTTPLSKGRLTPLGPSPFKNVSPFHQVEAYPSLAENSPQRPLSETKLFVQRKTTLGTPPAPARSNDVVAHIESPVFARPNSVLRGSATRRAKNGLPPTGTMIESMKPHIPPYDLRIKPASPLVTQVKKQLAEEAGLRQPSTLGMEQQRKLRTPKKQGRGFSGPELASPEPLVLSAAKRRLRSTPARQKKGEGEENMGENKLKATAQSKKTSLDLKKKMPETVPQYTPLRVSASETTSGLKGVNQLRGSLDSNTPMVGPVTRRMARQLEMAEKLG